MSCHPVIKIVSKTIMKKYSILFVFLLGVLNVFGQYALNHSGVKNQGYYYSKYRTQNKTGLILALGGTTMVVVGAVGMMSNFDLGNGNSAENKRAGIFSYVFLTGVVADVISIPFFLSARKNKRKASLTINNQKFYLLQNGTLVFHKQTLPSVTLHITL